MTLHDYFRSSAAYRVRIALNFKGLTYEQTFQDLRKGEQLSVAYVALNPQGLVPALLTNDGSVLTQSLAIIEWLEEIYPQPPLLPADALERARVRAFALTIACDIHPLQNLKVLKRLQGLSLPKDAVREWAATTISEGFAACETLASDDGPFCFGAAPTLADVCLVPQLANARRFRVSLDSFPRLCQIEAAAKMLTPFMMAEPERQPDATT